MNAPKTSEQKELYIYPLIQHGEIFEQHDNILTGNRKLCILSLTPLDAGCNLSLSLNHRQLSSVHCSLGAPSRESMMSFSQWEICQLFYTTLMNSRWRRRTSRSHFEFSETSQSIFPPYLVSCLSAGNLLDWDYMKLIIREYKRSDHEKKEAAQNWTGQKPRLFAPIYDPNNTYIAFEIETDKKCSSPFPDKEAEFESFRDYFLKNGVVRFHQMAI